ncbi:hypothetical protein Y1Q_0022196 [Alligator mississippiensis]|uniref:Uncharacterized protein n=1 Tax=Alligator mississippiensis TaxID=8496 RepID=A0A151NZM6_ALLMI|nr:hypothetical protein Y1Q_0022196 [Alligator mississippiensis]
MPICMQPQCSTKQSQQCGALPPAAVRVKDTSCLPVCHFIVFTVYQTPEFEANTDSGNTCSATAFAQHEME